MSDESHNELHRSIISRLEGVESRMMGLSEMLHQMRGRDSAISALVGLGGALIGAFVSGLH